MINPDKITKFNCTTEELEERILFWVLAAGKNGHRAAITLDKILDYIRGPFPVSPFTSLYNYYHHANIHIGNSLKHWMSILLSKFGSGCHYSKGETFAQLIHSGLDLHTCTVDDLEKIKGIGPKTARCFLIHSRPGVEYAGLDTHILKYLASQGYAVPKSTPTGKRYRELEQVFIELAKKSGKTIADFDLEIWKSYRKSFYAN